MVQKSRRPGLSHVAASRLVRRRDATFRAIVGIRTPLLLQCRATSKRRATQRAILGTEAHASPDTAAPGSADATQEAAQEPAHGLSWLQLRRVRDPVPGRVGARRLHAVARLQGYSRLREPRQVRASRDDAHPCARRRAHRRVRTRAAHLRADQHHSETCDQRVPFGRGQAVLRARRPRFARHRPGAV